LGRWWIVAELHVIVRIDQRGYGHMSRSQYEAIPAALRDRVELLAACPSEEKARWLFGHLPQVWRGITLTWRPSIGIERLAREFMAGERGIGDLGD
jgi:hypothetical protein